jgi:hypothetical protein
MARSWGTLFALWPTFNQVDDWVDNHEIAVNIDEDVFVVKVLDQDAIGVSIVFALGSGKTKASHERFDFGSLGAPFGADGWLGHDGPELAGRVYESLQFEPRSRKEQIVQRKAVEKIGVR